MRPFQRACVEALQPVLDVLGQELHWEAVECGPDEVLGHKPGDVYCRAGFNHDGRTYELYVYTDEAGTHVDGRWFIYERPGCEDDDDLLI